MKGGNCPRRCPYSECDEVFSNDSRIRTHLTNIHAVKADHCIDLTFSNSNEFERWQTKLQDEVGVWYKKISTYLRKDGVKVTNLRCQSGEARKGVLKEQLERYCPSAIILLSNNEGLLNGKYYPTHCGHYTRTTSVETLREAAVDSVSLEEFAPSVSLISQQLTPVLPQEVFLPPEQRCSSSGLTQPPPLVPAQSPSLVSPQPEYLRSTQPLVQQPTSTSILAQCLSTTCNDVVLNLSVNRVNVDVPAVKTVQPTPPPDMHCRINGTLSKKSTTSRKEPISSLSDLKLAVLRSEMTLVEAMDWIRNSFINGECANACESNKKAYERIRETHRMWCNRQKAIVGDRSVTTLLTGLMKLGQENPIVFEEIVDDDDLENEENYLIVILNPIQASMLREFGECGVVCVDIVLEEKGEGAFNMMSVNVIDGIGEPLPCAIGISDRTNRSVARQFFSVIKSKTGVVTPKIFICSQEEFYEQWRSVMAESQQLFLASWLVDASWREWITNLRISSDEQLALYTVLRGLMENLNVAHFETRIKVELNEIISNYRFEPNRFMLSKTRLWAFCYRNLEVHHCDLKLETLHREFLAFNLPKDEICTRKLDTLLLTVLDVVRRKCCERLTRMEPCLTPRLALLARRHDESFQCDVLEIQTLVCDSSWMVKTREGSSYVWRTDFPPCHHCKLSCSECDICIHKLMCTCFDNLVLYNLCVHLHIISRHIGDDLLKSKYSDVGAYSCTDCEQCVAERMAIEGMKAEIFARSAKLQEKLRTMMDIETLTVVKESLIAIQKMIDNTNGS